MRTFRRANARLLGDENRRGSRIVQTPRRPALAEFCFFGAPVRRRAVAAEKGGGCDSLAAGPFAGTAA